MELDSIDLVHQFVNLTFQVIEVFSQELAESLVEWQLCSRKKNGYEGGCWTRAFAWQCEDGKANTSRRWFIGSAVHQGS